MNKQRIPKEVTQEKRELVVSHDTASMTLMKDPSQRLGEVVRGIEDPWNVTHHNVPSIFPILDGKELDVNVARSLSGDLRIDHPDGRHVVIVDGGRTGRWEAKLSHDEAQVFGMLGSGDSREKLSLSGAGSSDGLGLATVGNSATIQEEGIAGDGATVAKVSCMGCIDITDEVMGRCGSGEIR